MGDSYTAELEVHGSQRSEGKVPGSEVVSLLQSSRTYPDVYCKAVTHCSSIKGIETRDLLKFILSWLLEPTRERIRRHAEQSRGRGPKHDGGSYLDFVHERNGYMLTRWGLYAVDSHSNFWQGFGGPRLSLRGDARVRFSNLLFVAIVLHLLE